MNSIKDRVFADIPAKIPKNGKERAAQYYLYLVGLYIVLVFNEFIKRPIDYLALVLIIAGLPLINKNNIKLLGVSILQSVAAKMVFWSLLIMSALFFLATLKQLPRHDGLIAFGAQYGAHVGLAGMALMVIPLNEKTIDFLFNCLLLALFALVLTDIGFYIWDINNNIAIGSNYSHRWFGDGYIFLTPFLLARILANQAHCVRDATPRMSGASLFFQPSLYVLLFAVVVLSGGTGARSTYLVLVCECLFFFMLFAKQQRWSWIRTAGACFLLLLMIMTMFGLLAPDLLGGAVSRGFGIWDRVSFAWGPGIALSLEAPFLGHGFGARAWDAAFGSLQSINSEIINFGSPHNWFLAASYFGGISAAIAQICLTLSIVVYALHVLIYGDKAAGINLTIDPQKLLLASLVSFIAFYLIRGLVEFTIYKYLSIFLINFGVIFVLNSFKSYKDISRGDKIR